MLDVMYEVPSRNDISKCVITEKVVKEKMPPDLITKDGDSKTKEESA